MRLRSASNRSPVRCKTPGGSDVVCAEPASVRVNIAARTKRKCFTRNGAPCQSPTECDYIAEPLGKRYLMPAKGWPEALAMRVSSPQSDFPDLSHLGDGAGAVCAGAGTAGI